MAPTYAPASPTRRRPTARRRFGYLVAIAVNAAMLWVAYHLLGWGWPGFVSHAFDEVLPLLAASLVISIVANTIFLVVDRGRFRALADLVTAAFALPVSLRTWAVFPFDFVGYGRDWSWLLRTGLIFAVAGTAIAIVVHTSGLVSGAVGPGR